MIKAKYYKDYNHNYMILESGDEAENTYQYRMLASNKIERILRCSIRDINGEVYFYYDISSKVSVENLYRGKFLSYEQAKDFFMQLDMIYKNLGQFFMNEGGLLLRPDCIYYDLDAGKYFGMYYPGGNKASLKESGMENTYEELMDFLLKHIDNKDQKLVDNMYRIYEMSENQNFMLSDALQVFEEREVQSAALDLKNIIEAGCPNDAVVNNIAESPINAAPMHSGEDGYYNGYEDEDDYSFASLPVKKEKKKTGKGNGINAAKNVKTDRNIRSGRSTAKKYYGIFALISLGGIFAVAWIYFNYKLTQKELMMIICCLALMAVCFMFSLIQFMSAGKKALKDEEAQRELLYDIEDEFRDERAVPVHEILDKNAGMALENRVINAGGRSEASAFSAMPAGADMGARYGETIFMDVRKQRTEYKLYALDKKNKKHIELTQFPFTIGKMAGCVDCVIMDDSISRLHARIEKQDEKVLLTDMNSTNGTYKNGLRMEPSETVELEPGDEIRFGKLNYCYR